MTDMSSRIGPHLIAVLHGGAVAALTGCGSGSESVTLAFERKPVTLAFEEVTEEAGLDTVSLSWGLAWGDGNGDGAPDLWSSNHGSEAHAYLNRKDGRFARVRRPHLRPSRGDSHGAAWADFDGDGDEDLLELVGAQRGVGTGTNHFYVNHDGHLTDRAEELGLAFPLGRGRMPLWFDWNRDGELDVLLTHSEREEVPNTLFLQRSGRFERADVPFGTRSSMFAQLVPFGERARPHLFVHGYDFPQLVYDLSVDPPADVTESLDLPFAGSAEDVVFADFDGDGRTDYFVAKGWLGNEIRKLGDHEMRAKLVTRDDVRGVSFICDGPLEVRTRPDFSDWWPASSVAIEASGKSPETNPFEVDAASARGTWSDDMTAGKERGLFLLHNPETGRWSMRMLGGWDEGTIEFRSEAVISDPRPIGWEKYEPPYDALVMWRDGVYVDVARENGIERTNSQAAAAGDFDNDMDVDLYVLISYATENRPNILYENLGDGTFRIHRDGSGASGVLTGVSDTCAVADYDGDGYLDLAIGNGREIGADGGPLQLFRNLGLENHWLRLDLRGTRSNPDAIGACVRLLAGGVEQVRIVGDVMHRGAQDERTVHFGLGSNEVAARVHILWPSGAETVLESVAADQRLEVVEE